MENDNQLRSYVERVPVNFMLHHAPGALPLDVALTRMLTLLADR
jgi:hypothetical protein